MMAQRNIQLLEIEKPLWAAELKALGHYTDVRGFIAGTYTLAGRVTGVTVKYVAGAPRSTLWHESVHAAHLLAGDDGQAIIKDMNDLLNICRNENVEALANLERITYILNYRYSALGAAIGDWEDGFITDQQTQELIDQQASDSGLAIIKQKPFTTWTKGERNEAKEIGRLKPDVVASELFAHLVSESVKTPKERQDYQLDKKLSPVMKELHARLYLMTRQISRLPQARALMQAHLLRYQFPLPKDF